MRTPIHLLILLTIFGFACALGDEEVPIAGHLIVQPQEIEVTKANPYAAILIAWEIQNKSESLIRFRTRDLGRLVLLDPDGNEIISEGLGVDHTKKYELKDYPVIQPQQTLYFPFAISFEVRERLGLCLKVQHDPNSQEGWLFPISKKGLYSISAKYSVKKFSKDNPLWGVELEMLDSPGFGCQNFWEGEITSNIVNLRIQTSATGEEQFDVKSAIQEFSKLPDWTKLHEDNIPLAAEKITNTLNKYKRITHDEAEKLVRELLQIGDEFDMENNGKVYLFNRVYCDVPSYVERDQWRFFGGWSGVPVTETEVNSLYPFTVKDDGTLELTGVFGGYFGSEYLGLEEFKYFLKRFGQRERPEKNTVLPP